MTTRAMSPLQQRMLEDMQLRGLSARTQRAGKTALYPIAQTNSIILLSLVHDYTHMNSQRFCGRKQGLPLQSLTVVKFYASRAKTRAVWRTHQFLTLFSSIFLFITAYVGWHFACLFSYVCKSILRAT
jgi:hypothetical protein